MKFPRSTLAAIFLLLAASSLLWISRNSRPPGPDTAAEIRTSLDFSRAISHFSPAKFIDVLRSHDFVPYPPVDFIVTGGQFALTHPSIDWAPAANLIWMLLFTVAVYALGIRYFSTTVALWAVALTWTMDIVAAFVREVSLEIALMAVLTIALYCLLRSENFTNSKFTLLFGLVSALGLLVKESFPIYLFLPTIYVFFRKPSLITRKNLSRVVLAAVLALGIAALWYWPHWVEIRNLYALNRAQAVTEHDPIGWNLAAVLFYPNALLNYYLTPVFAVLFLLALFQNWRRASEAKRVILLWLVGSYFILSFLIDNKDVRHLVPCAPALALLVSDWLLHRSPWIKRAGMALLLIFSALYFTASQWGYPRYDGVIQFRTAQYDWRLWDGALFRETVPHEENWSIPELIEGLKADADRHPFHHAPVRLGVIPFLFRYNDQTLRCYAEFQNFPLTAQALGNEPDPAILLNFDYVITKSGTPGVPGLTTQAAAMNSFIQSHSPAFTPVGSFPLPDGSLANALRRTEPDAK